MSNKRSLLIVLALCLALSVTLFGASTVIADEPPEDGPVSVRKWVTDSDGPTEAEIRALNERLRQVTPAEAAAILADYARANSLDTTYVPPPPPARRGQPRNFRLQLGDRTLFPSPGLEPAVSSLARTLTQVGATDRQAALARFPTQHIPCIVQFNRELSIDERIALYNLGLKLGEPVADDAVLSLVPAESVAALADLPFVRWVGQYELDFKYQSGEGWSNGAWVFPIGPAQSEYADSLHALGLSADYDAVMDAYLVEGVANRVADVAGLWWVRHIALIETIVNLDAPESDVEFNTGDSREMIGASYVWPTYTGVGVTVGVFDGGLWAGNTADFPSGSIHPSSDITTPDEEAHGTHVSGIIAARGGYDIEGPYDAKGIAPGAVIYMKDHGGSDSGLSAAFDAWESVGARVSNHSWGVEGNYSYGWQAEELDERSDAGDHIIVAAAGNEGSTDAILNPATAKNAVTVGAVNYVVGNAVETVGKVSNYSSAGPTQDGRLKPDVVAPGGADADYTSDYFKLGIVSTNAKVGSSWVVTDSHSVQDYWEPITYTRKSGTSQAAPHVAGTAALMMQWDSDMTSELFKAWLVATTIPLGRDGGSDPRNGYASINTGYGLLNAYNAAGRAYGGESDYLLIMEGTVTEDTDEQDESAFYVPASTQRLIVTLAYDDEEGCTPFYGADGCLEDDLDLRLTAPGGAVYTYTLPQWVSTESPLEKIIVEDPVSGWWDVEVLFSYYASNPLKTSSQDYAVVAYAIYKTPALAFADPYFSGGATPTFRVQPGSAVYTPTLVPAVENSGGWIAAGVTTKISKEAGPAGTFAGIKEKFVGNLMWEGHTRSITYTGVLTAPTTEGTYQMRLEATAVNTGVQTISKAFEIIVDDDFDPPAFTSYADSGDAVAGPYTFTVTLSDFSGINDAADSPRVYYRWNSSSIDADSNDGWVDGSVSGSGPNYTGEATLTVPGSREGDTLYWRPYACDGDDTSECAWGTVQTGGTIQPGTPAAPGAPADLTATPDSWTHINSFSVDWTDPGGIAGAYYKLGSPPTYDTDGTYTTAKPFNVAATVQGGQTLYVWLKGTDGGVDYSNRSSVVLYYDGTDPINPTTVTGWDSASENTSYADDTWQNDDSDLYFEWSGAGDAGGSGLSGYSIYWGTSSSGEPGTTLEQTTAYIDTSAFGGTYYLRVRTFDDAGNYSAPVTLFTARYEDTAPTNPSRPAGPACTMSDDVWQNTCNDPNFTWSGASDTGGSGLYGYSVYWGTSSSGEPGTTPEQTATGYNPSAFDGAYYLRVRTFDNAGNYSAPITLYAAKYDDQGPTGGTIAINNGAGSTTALTVTLNSLSAIDSQSGMGAGARMRFSSDGSTWSSWEAYASTKTNWDLSAYGGDTSGGTKVVYVQYRDVVHNESESFSDEIVYVVPVATDVVLNEIDPGASDAIEIYNAGTSAADMTNWQLLATQPDGLNTSYTFPSFTLAAGAYVVVHETSGTDTATDLYMAKNIYWDSSGNGSCSLMESGGSGVDFVRWGSSTQPSPSPTGWTGTNPQFTQPTGTTLGRDAESTDTDDGSDWSEQTATLGGFNGPPAPTADFAASPRSGYPPLTVEFTNGSTGEVDNYAWDFGDGYGGADQEPVHTYDTSGAYTVTLSVIGPGGSDSETRASYINVWELEAGQEVFGLNSSSGIASNSHRGNVFSVTTPTKLTGIKFYASIPDPSSVYFFVYEGDNQTGSYTKVFQSITADGITTSGSQWISLTGINEVLQPGQYYYMGMAWTNSATYWWGGSSGVCSFGAVEGRVSEEVDVPGSPVTINSILSQPYYMALVTEPLQPPSAEFTAWPTSGQEPLQVLFINLSSGHVEGQLWGFGDGGTSTEEHPYHTYTSAGTFTVTLTVTNSAGSDVKTRVAYIQVNEPPPVANFTAGTRLGAAPLTVQFTDQSVGTITSYTWDFGDGGISAATNPTHTYTSAGVYTAALSVEGPYGSDTEVKPRYVRVLEAREDVIGGTTEGYSTYGQMEDWGSVIWATTDTQIKEMSIYLNVPITTSLRFFVYEWDPIWGNVCHNDWNRIHENHVPGVEAGIGWRSSGSITPVNLQHDRYYYIGVSHDGSDVRPYLGWDKALSFGTWLYGNFPGDTWAGYPPSPTLPPTDTVCTTGDTNQLPYYFAFATGGPPTSVQADLTASPRSGVSPLTVQFEDLSSGTVTDYLWGFGNGDTSTEISPTYEYLAGGSYTITLTAHGPFGTDTVTKTAYINVDTSPEGVPFFDDIESGVGRWTYDGFWHQVDASSAYSESHSPSHSWWYGQESTGDYDSGWWRNSGSLTSPPIELSADMDGAVLTFWDWFETEIYNSRDQRWVQISVDGQTFQNLQQMSNSDPMRTWRQQTIDLSSYVGSVVWVRFYFDNVEPFNDDYRGWYIDDVQVLEELPPDAAFVAAPSEGSRPLEVQFTDASSGNVDSRWWHFGDGATSTAISPTHTYTSSGDFLVTLVVTNAGGSDSHSDTITVVEPPPVADFGATPTSGTWPLTVTFSNATLNEVTSYLWDLGDGTTSTEISPTHVYTSAGSFTVVLTATGPYGTDAETKADYIAVDEASPQTDFASSATGGIVQHIVAFTPTIGGGPATSYEWTFGDGDTSTEVTPTHTYTTAGIYTVTLTAGGPGGSDAETKAAYAHVAPTPVTDLAFGSWDGGSWTGAARDRGNLYYVVTPTILSDVRFYLNVTADTELHFFVYEGTSLSGSFNKVHETPLTYSGIGQGWYGSGQMDVRLEAGRYYYIGCAWNGVATYGRGTEGVPFGTAFGQLVSGVSGELAGYPPTGSIGSLSASGQSPYYIALGVEIEPPPQADFTATPTVGNDPLAVEFTNASTGTVTSLLWDFGDGTSSTVENPGHVYTTTGSYTVILTVTGPGGTDVETKTEYVEVYDPGPGVMQRFGTELAAGDCAAADAGDVFEVTTTTKLSRIDIYLQGTNDKDMYYFVYEGTALPGGFTKVFQKYVPNAGAGDRWYSSDWIDVTLKAGRYYYIGASWNAYACSPRGTVSGPIDTAFGVFRRGDFWKVAGWPDHIPDDISSTISDAMDVPRALTVYTGDWSHYSAVYLPIILKSY